MGSIWQPAAYIGLLRDFTAEHRHLAPRFLVLLDAGRHEDARHLAHTLNGTAGFFGLTAIRSRANALETALRNGVPEEEMIGMIVALADAVADLAAVIGS